VIVHEGEADDLPSLAIMVDVGPVDMEIQDLWTGEASACEVRQLSKEVQRLEEEAEHGQERLPMLVADCAGRRRG